MLEELVPENLRTAGVRHACVLDIRPLLARVEGPFAAIMRLTDALAADEALHLIAPFRPQPLYDVMRARGCSASTTSEGAVVHVWFSRVAS